MGNDMTYPPGSDASGCCERLLFSASTLILNRPWFSKGEADLAKREELLDVSPNDEAYLIGGNGTIATAARILGSPL